MSRPELCVVFDLDDTLYLERDYVRSGFCAVGKWCEVNLGLRSFQRMAQSLFDQGSRGDIFDTALRSVGIIPERSLIDAMVRVYREHTPDISLADDATECLARLRSSVQFALLTDGNSKSQWAKIDALGIRSVFDPIVVTGDWGAEFFKPHVRGFRQVEAHFEECEARFVYVADNPLKDFFAPFELGWSSIRVRRPNGLHESCPCPSGLVQQEIQDLSLLPDLLDN